LIYNYSIQPSVILNQCSTRYRGDTFVFNFQYLISRLLPQLLMNHILFYFDFLQSLHQLLHKLLCFYCFKRHSMCTLVIYCSFTAKTFFQDYFCNASWICNWTTFTWILSTTFTIASFFLLHLCFTTTIQPFLTKHNASFGYTKPFIETTCCLLMLIYFST
jgi:hypothetical protein